MKFISVEGETTNRYEPKVILKDKIYPKTYYKHQACNVQINKTLTKVKAQELQIIGWTFTKEQQLTNLNLGTQVELQMVKVNSILKPKKVLKLEELLQEYNDVFAWMYN